MYLGTLHYSHNFTYLICCADTDLCQKLSLCVEKAQVLCFDSTNYFFSILFLSIQYNSWSSNVTDIE